ncbi:FAD-dependent oxidoreductase [uncultured Roseobacter sp.]|uniref:NAD(P)/FAD-dependent oxidoreductase n=1 Tax=uncultured Roseobacter sp. TaxID=114847 RepID=UPI0026196541|nr:FAD-dependent oxidoreductase [uncultured Roseobacter sp.]
MKVIIVGAGIIGALTAFRLAERGAEVTVIDAGQPAGAASGASFGWINASFYADQDHFNLRLAAIAAHHRLAAELKSDAIRWSGCLCWEAQGDAIDEQHKTLKSLGYAVSEVSEKEFSALEPAVSPPQRALHFADEGAVDLTRLASEALQAGARHGVHVLAGLPVTGLLEAAGKITGVQTPAGVLTADQVIVAAGVATEQLLADIGVAVPMLSRPGLIVRSEPLPPLLRHVLVSPEQELRQTPQGHLLAPTIANHQGDSSDSVPEPPDVLASRAMARVQAMIGRPVAWDQVTLAFRPVPQDGLPVIGACGPAGLYVTVMHSGATLAPLVAELAAAEVMESALSNTQLALLSPYRPARFTG